MTSTTPATALETVPVSRAKKALRIGGWVGFALVCLITFTVLKLPEDRIKAFINGTIQSLLAPRGITFSAGSSRVGYLFGLSYTLKDVTLSFPGQETPNHIDQIQISPSLFSLATGGLSASFSIRNLGGELSGSVSMTSPNETGDFKLSATADQLDISKLGLLKTVANLSGGGILSGSANVAGDFNVPSTLEGRVQITVKKIQLDPQSIMGFAVPAIAAPELDVDMTSEKGKVKITSLKIAKGGDIWATVTGSLALSKLWENSTLDLKTQFGVSESVMKAFILLEALLASAKQADGSYGYSFSGTIANPIANPNGAGAT